MVVRSNSILTESSRRARPSSIDAILRRSFPDGVARIGQGDLDAGKSDLFDLRTTAQHARRLDADHGVADPKHIAARLRVLDDEPVKRDADPAEVFGDHIGAANIGDKFIRQGFVERLNRPALDQRGDQSGLYQCGQKKRQKGDNEKRCEDTRRTRRTGRPSRTGGVNWSALDGMSCSRRSAPEPNLTFSTRRIPKLVVEPHDPQPPETFRRSRHGQSHIAQYIAGCPVKCPRIRRKMT
jgi:hypothetical protein